MNRKSQLWRLDSQNSVSGNPEAVIRSKPTGRYARRIWFLYEWLTGHRLDIEDATGGAYVPVVDPQKQYAIDAVNVSLLICMLH
jgi:hypothetical protein